MVSTFCGRGVVRVERSTVMRSQGRVQQDSIVLNARAAELKHRGQRNRDIQRRMGCYRTFLGILATG